jgi:hypothetical protein
VADPRSKGYRVIAVSLYRDEADEADPHTNGLCLNIVRFKNTIATFVAILAVAAGVPEGCASQGVVTALAQRSAQDRIGSSVLQQDAAPAETSASRGGARIRVAASSRPNPLHSGIPSARVAPSSPDGLGTIVRASGTPTAFVPVPTSLVRGPPLAI